ncbi:retropepsin-like aspartic protease family protein [Sphingobium boeckii]|uniref:Aspartyl protease family protein n=1 Tax=Sphingobium boeckii TaxID=1082345 RepID=A0A7W9EGN8_9SPHN|nr:TIGR02281 family clan AA aspartic protease [Sphingobium boeckii]MBB5687305.1 aspartyl protease family protein [Sphingobium boeckii]
MQLVAALGCLVLVASSLAARRLPLKDTAKMALAWVAIFGFGFMLYALKDDFGGLWNRVKLAGAGQSEDAVGGTLRIARGDDGHFSVNASVNGRPVRFMIDTGATTTSLTSDAAKAANVAVDESGYPVIVDTANGMAEGRRARMATIELGPIKRADVGVIVMPGMSEMNLLGMNFLSSLKSWRVEGSTLILES